jgi:hypothetical protein
MIENGWKRIAGFHWEEHGDAGAAWLAHDKTTDTVHVYDACMFRKEVLAVIAEGMNARGRWIPIAWEKGAEEIIKKLLDRGCNTLVDPSKQTPVLAEAISRDVKERMVTGRFKVDKRLSEWLDEYRGFTREDGQVPLKAYPLMSATRHAMADLDYARARERRGRNAAVNYPKVAII